MLVVPVVSILSHINQVHTVQSYVFKIHFCSSLLSRPRTSMTPSFNMPIHNPAGLTLPVPTHYTLRSSSYQLFRTPVPVGLLLTPCAHHSSLFLVGLLLTQCTSVVSCFGWSTDDTVCTSLISCPGWPTTDTVCKSVISCSG